MLSCSVVVCLCCRCGEIAESTGLWVLKAAPGDQCGFDDIKVHGVVHETDRSAWWLNQALLHAWLVMHGLSCVSRQTELRCGMTLHDLLAIFDICLLSTCEQKWLSIGQWTQFARAP